MPKKAVSLNLVGTLRPGAFRTYLVLLVLSFFFCFLLLHFFLSFLVS